MLAMLINMQGPRSTTIPDSRILNSPAYYSNTAPTERKPLRLCRLAIYQSLFSFTLWLFHFHVFQVLVFKRVIRLP